MRKWVLTFTQLLLRAGSLCARALSTILMVAGADAGGGQGCEGDTKSVDGNGAQDGLAGRWKRFGVDFIVDASCELWLIGACRER